MKTKSWAIRNNFVITSRAFPGINSADQRVITNSARILLSSDNATCYLKFIKLLRYPLPRMDPLALSLIIFNEKMQIRWRDVGQKIVRIYQRISLPAT